MPSAKGLNAKLTLSDFETARKLAELLVTRVQKLLPSEFIVTADEARVRIGWNGELSMLVDLGWVLQDRNQTVKEKIASAAYSVLDALQDFVAEHSGQPWPPLPSSSSSDFALPRTSWIDNQLQLGYGDGHELNLTPISLAELKAE